MEAVGRRVESGVGGERAAVEAVARAPGSVIWWISPRKRRSSTKRGHATACHAAADGAGRYDRPAGPTAEAAEPRARTRGEPVSRRQLRARARGADRRPRARGDRRGPARPRRSPAPQRAESGVGTGGPGRLPLVHRRRDDPRRRRSAAARATGYRNRWVRTRALAAKVATPPPDGPSEPIDGPANTHVIRHAGTTLALVESGFPHAVSPDLDRARIHDFDGVAVLPHDRPSRRSTRHRGAGLLRGRPVRAAVPALPRGRRRRAADRHRGHRDPAGHDDARLRGDRHPCGLPRPARRLRPRPGRPGPVRCRSAGCPRPDPGSA